MARALARCLLPGPLLRDLGGCPHHSQQPEPDGYRDVPRDGDDVLGGEGSTGDGSPLMLCPRCQTKNREGRRFCSKRAAPLAIVCAACGFTNDPGDTFCGGCAQSLGAVSTSAPKYPSSDAYTAKHLAERILTSKTAREGERKQVTVLFADLKGSMELLADRDPEEARKILDPVLEHMMDHR